MIGDKLIGTWELVKFEATMPDGRVVSPYGRTPRGQLIYSADGFVGVNMSRGGLARGEEGKAFHNLDDAVVGPLARSYMAYSGRYHVDEAQSLVRHDFEMCIDPALIGTLQIRYVRFIDDKLELSVRQAAGVDAPSALLWRRP